MSYNITYDPDLKKRYPPARKQTSRPLNRALILLVSFVAVYILSQSGILRYFIPGDPEITAEAFSQMVTRIGEGETVGNAITDFCKEILAGGQG